MIRRYGEPVRAGIRYRRRPGVYAVLRREGQVLLTFQESPDAEFQLPGGGIDPGEAPIAALHREVYEETGWRISTPRLVGVYRRFVFMPDYDNWAEKVCAIYEARPTLCMGPPTEAGHTAVWTNEAAALSLLDNLGDREMARRVLQGG